MTRFFLTVQDGVKVVLSSLAMMEGGELFVPKIPSVKVVDLVEAMLPGGDHPVIGIRPGEKLHEIMVSEDDARVTLELPDRYVIEPLFDFWDRTALCRPGCHSGRRRFFLRQQYQRALARRRGHQSAGGKIEGGQSLMPQGFLNYGRQAIGEDDIAAVVDVLRGDWLTTGPAVERFEAALCEETGAEHAVVCNSGTAALYLAARAAGLKSGDSVIVPAMTFAATASANVLAGVGGHFRRCRSTNRSHAGVRRRRGFGPPRRSAGERHFSGSSDRARE